MATVTNNTDLSNSLFQRLTYFLGTALVSPDLDCFDLDPVTRTVRTHPFVSAGFAFLLSAWLLIRHVRNRRLPPGPWAWPIVGHLTCLLTNPHFRLSHLRDVYGDVYQLKCGGRRVVVLNSLEAVLQGLVGQGDDVSQRPDFESFEALYHTSRQQGVCCSDVSEWTRVKKQFINAAVDAYCSDASRIEDKLSSEIVDLVNQLTDIRVPSDPATILHMACLNVALNLTFSQRFDPAGRMASEILKTYQWRSSVFGLNAVDFFPPLKALTASDHHDYIRQQTGQLLNCVRRFLNFHKDTYDPHSLRDFTDQLLLFVESGEDSSLLHKDDIEYLLLDMAGYGFQATAVTLTWLLGYMALNQDVQSEVHKEIDSVVGRDRLPCLEDQPYLPLTVAVIYEVQRLASVRPFLIPHRTRRTTVIQDYEIPGDTVVLFNMWGLHHDPRYWPDPTRFDPHRFLTEDRRLEIPDHFLPYGAGARQCPGESLADVQLFLFFTTMMHQLLVLPSDPNMALEGVFDHLLRPKCFTVTVVERD